DRGWARAQAGHIAVLDVGALAALLDPGVPPRFDGLSISLAPGVSAAAIARQIQPLIPAGDSVRPPASRQRQADKMLAAFQDNLLALSFVALLVGAFLIYQTMTMAVLRRRSAIAVVRALGAPARTVRAVMLTEAAAVGTLGALAGLGIGWLFARAAVRGLSATVNNLYAVSHPEPLRLTPADLALALLLAWLVAVIAAWGPAREAAGIAPARALRPEEPELEFRGHQRRWAAAGAGFAVVALAAAWLPSPFGLPLNGYLSALAAVLAAALAAPPLLRGVLPAARRWLLARRQPRLALAAASLLASQRRAAILIAALATAIAMVVGVAAMVASFRQTVSVWLGETLQAQVYVQPLAWSRRHPAPIPPALVRLALGTPGVAGASFYFTAPLRFRRQTALLATRWSPGASPQQALTAGLRFLQPPSRAARGGQPLVYVSEPFARRFGLWRGAQLRLDTRVGWRTARIAGVFYDYSSSQGIVRLDVASYRRWFGAPPVTHIALDAVPGLAPAVLRRRVALRLARAGGAFSVHDQAALKRQALAVFDQTFRITGALELIALVVALLGVANTLWAMTLERRRELAVLRFLGAMPRQLRGLLLAEAAWIGLFSVILGAALGAALAAILTYVVNVESFGWTIQVHPPWVYLAAALALLYAATVAAGWLPARWAARADPLAALTAE
ncbi:MAG: ABC transporter permease, partial [Terriglobales bacterium]